MPGWLFASFHDYDRKWLWGDGRRLTVWAVLVPEALAYASIAGVSPVIGLYAAPAPGAGPELTALAGPRLGRAQLASARLSSRAR